MHGSWWSPVTDELVYKLKRYWRNDSDGFGAMLANNMPGYKNVLGSNIGATAGSSNSANLCIY